MELRNYSQGFTTHVFRPQIIDFCLQPLGKQVDLFRPDDFNRPLKPGSGGDKQTFIRPQTPFFNGDKGCLVRFSPKRNEILVADFCEGKIAEQAGIDILAVNLENPAEFVTGIADLAGKSLKTHENDYITDFGFAESPAFSYDADPF